MNKTSKLSIEVKSIRMCGFPVMNVEPSLSKAPPSTSVHFPVTATVLGKFCCFDKKDLPPLPQEYSSLLWNLPEKGETMEWATESDIGNVVWMAMVDVYREMGFNKFLKIARELKKFFTKPDFYLYVQEPVGGVEVKKPAHGILDDVNVLGEVFDQLMHLKNESGIKSPFVLVTSYMEWRVCWLNDEESNSLAGKKCVFGLGEGLELHPEVDTPQKSGQDNSPESSPERHAQKVDLGKV